MKTSAIQKLDEKIAALEKEIHDRIHGIIYSPISARAWAKMHIDLSDLKSRIFCERCGERLRVSAAKWLELSETDGNYYVEIPKGHISQGCFSFGTACATTELKATTEKLKSLNTAGGL